METVQSLKFADVVNARTFLIKLAIILEDASLHQPFLMSDGMALLVDLLYKALLAGDTEPYLSIIISAVQCLLYIAHSDPVVKAKMASDVVLLLNLLR